MASRNLVLGYHGCEEAIAERILAGAEKLRPSEKPYDWLGHGAYFWEGSPARAMDWAVDRKLSRPAVLGAVIELGNCLDLDQAEALGLVREAYNHLRRSHETHGFPLPVNTGDKDLKKRHLDCAVIEFLHQVQKEEARHPPFDTIRGFFIEGEPLYENAGFRKLDHVQICVRNDRCIRGFFRVRKPETFD